MIPADIDPSLCTGEPTLESLDDGFSPPTHEKTDPHPAEPAGTLPAELGLPPKSPF